MLDAHRAASFGDNCNEWSDALLLQEADLLKADLKGQAAAVSKERRKHEQHSVRMLAASLDLAARYRVEGDEQTAHAELRGFKVATQINLSEAQAHSEAEEVIVTEIWILGGNANVACLSGTLLPEGLSVHLHSPKVRLRGLGARCPSGQMPCCCSVVPCA